jgi:septal ring factor EnvC (AmiA/AmiB activator)
VAEDVEKVNPDLVARDEQGKPYTVRYEAVNTMLLNEFLKEHRKVEQQQATIAQLKEDFQVAVARLGERLEEQAAQIQKVNAELEARKSSPQIVLNNQ